MTATKAVASISRVVINVIGPLPVEIGPLPVSCVVIHRVDAPMPSEIRQCATYRRLHNAKLPDLFGDIMNEISRFIHTPYSFDDRKRLLMKNCH